MLLDGLELLGNTDAVNFSVDSGLELALSGKIGELFFLFGDPETVGLYVYTGEMWKRIGSDEFKLVPGNGINFNEDTGEISTTIPVNATEGQILATKNNNLVWVTFTKADVGLGNVDNTSDANKPISVSTQSALDQKVDRVNPVFEGTITGITKESVGLGNVDNTADRDKPVSDATQDALDLKADIDSPTFTGTVSGITKGMVGLGNADNTSDTNKPISTATQNALNLKADKTYVDNKFSEGVGQGDFDQAIADLQNNLQTTIEYVDNSLTLKSDITYVDNKLVEKADKTAVDSALALKADKTYVDTQLSSKTSKTYVDNALTLKADKTYVDGEIADLESALNNKASTTYVDQQIDGIDSALDLKADKSYVDSQDQALVTSIATKTSKSYVDNGLGLKADVSYVETEISNLEDAIALKANKSYVDDQLLNVELKANKNQPNGYVGLGADSKIDPQYLPETSGGGAVESVNDKTGVVVLTKDDIGLGNVNNTSDLEKPISTATQNALNNALTQTRTGIFTVNSTIVQRVEAASPTSLSINPNLGNHFKKSINTTGNASFTFGGDPPTGSYTCIVEIQVVTVGTVGWPSNVYWPNNQAPVLGSGKTHLVLLNTSNSGVVWHGSSLTGFNA